MAKKNIRVLSIVIGTMILFVMFLAGTNLLGIFKTKVESPEETPIIASTTSFVPTTITPTKTPALISLPTKTIQPISQKIDSQLTGHDVEQTYSIDLKEGEVIVGHSGNISFAKGTYRKDYHAVSFLIVGPGHFDFWVYSGHWDKWTEISQQKYKSLLQEQFDYDVLQESGSACFQTLPVCIGKEGYIDCPMIDCP